MMKLDPGQKAPILEEEDDDTHDTETVFMVHDQNIDLEHGEIYLFSDIEFSYGDMSEDVIFADPGVTYVMALKFIKNLRILSQHLDDDETILIHMNTPGGGWVPGMAIYSALSMCPQRTVILNYGEARSMSSIIPQAASRFVMMPVDSRFMYHTGCFGGLFTGTQIDTEYLEHQKAMFRMQDIYVDAIKRRKGKNHKWSRDKLHAWLRAEMKEHEEVYLDPEEAVEHGFADAVFDGDWEALTDF
jgi:ATP-dependent protease ClpP protease subunit